MTGTCFYHSDRAAAANCAQCGVPVCEDCREIVAGKPVCKNCVGAIRARLAAETTPGAGYAAPSPAPHYASNTFPNVSSPVSSDAPPARLALGALLGLVIGLVGAVIWEKVVYLSHFNIGYLTALIGFGVGWGVLKGGGRTGLTPAIMGAVIAFIAQIFGYCLLAADESGGGMSVLPLLLSPHGLGLVIKYIDVLGWVILAIGVYGGFKLPYRAGLTQKTN